MNQINPITSLKPDNDGTFTKIALEKARAEDKILQEEKDKEKKLRDAIRTANNKPRIRN